jgi:hypothetical protein
MHYFVKTSASNLPLIKTDLPLHLTLSLVTLLAAKAYLAEGQLLDLE